MRKVFWGCVVSFLVLFLVVSCEFASRVLVLDEDGGSSDVSALLQKTTVRLFEGVEKDDLGLSLEDRVLRLSNGLSKKHGRSLIGTDVMGITFDELASIIQSQLDVVTIPELLEPTAEDIAIISQDFPGLTEDEILVELEAISRVYQDQIGALAENAFLSADYEPVPDGITRSLYEGAPTVYEIAAALKHPLSALTITKQKDKAFALTGQYMGSTEVPTNTKKDAFRHAIWNIVMAKEGWGLKKEKIAWAKDMATAHEKGGNYVKVDSEMDLHNNTAGIRYYDANSTRKYTKILFIKIETGVSEPSYEKAASAIKTKAESAKFVDKSKIGDSDAIKEINGVGADALVYIKK